MGYTTDFSGRVEITPPLNQTEIDFLKKFAGTRRMNRHNGPYYVDNKGMAGQDHEKDIIDYNSPPKGQPGLWCKWVPTDDGKFIEWDGGEKFYNASEWMTYIMEHFMKPNPRLSHVGRHICNGEIEAHGEEAADRWKLIVRDNKVSVKRGAVTY